MDASYRLSNSAIAALLLRRMKRQCPVSQFDDPKPARPLPATFGHDTARRLRFGATGQQRALTF